MAETTAFETASACLEQSSSLTSIEARGTIRLALKAAGFDAKTATARALTAVVERVLPAELRSRRIADPDTICAKIALALEGIAGEPATDTAEAVFARLGGGR